jgi:hypothetical protein
VSGKVKHCVDDKHVAKAVDHARKFLLVYGEDGGLADDSELHDRWWRSRHLDTLLGSAAWGFEFDPPWPLQWNEAFCQELIARANQGDGEAVCVLRTAAAMSLRAGVTVPTSLAAWTANYLTKGPPAKSSSRRGPHSRANVQRDRGIAHAIKTMTREPWGFAATRNRAGKAESACSIVHKALTDLRIASVSERAVEKIWAQYRDRI